MKFLTYFFLYSLHCSTQNVIPQEILVSFGQYSIQLQLHGRFISYFQLKAVPFLGVYSKTKCYVAVGRCFFSFFIRIQFVLLH